MSKSKNMNSNATYLNDYFGYLKKLVREHPEFRKAVAYTRLSTRKQKADGNFEGYKQKLNTRLSTYGFSIIDSIEEVCCGKANSLHSRKGFRHAVRIAKQHKAIIVTDSLDRFLRSDLSSRKNPYVFPSKKECRQFKKIAKGVPVVTIFAPDRPLEDIAGAQKKRGQDIKGNSGGRSKVNRPGDLKRRREEKKPEVLRLHKKGWSRRQIARKTKIPLTTVQRWITEG